MKKKWLGVIAVCLLVAGAAGAVFAGTRFSARDSEYKAAQDEYSQLRSEFVTGGTAGGEEAAPTPADIDVAALKAQNPDCVGWIEIPGTDISYPILQGESNETYLRHTFDRSYLLSGSIFMDFRNKADYTDFNTIIFGHNMRDGTMFSQLSAYLGASFLSEHDIIFIHTEKGVLTYKILTAKKTDINDSIYQTINPSEPEIKRFLTDLGEAGDSYMPEDRYLTLSTCSDGGGNDARTLVIARQLQKDKG